MANWLEILKSKLDEIISYTDTEIQEIIGDINDGSTGLPAIKAVVDEINDDKIGTLTNTGGTATIGTMVGDTANITIVSRLDTIDGVVDNINSDVDSGTYGLSAIKTAVDAISSAVTGIQNNTKLTTSLPSEIDTPDTGTTATKIYFNIYDSAGNSEDPDSSIVAIKVENAAATDLTTRLYKEAALTNNLDTVGAGTFTGEYELEKDTTGRYFAFYKSTSTDTPEVLNFNIQFEEGAVLVNHDRATTIVEEIGDASATLANQTLIKGAGFNGTTDSLEAIRDAIDVIDTVVDGIDSDIGTLTNTGGTATLGAIIGDVANISIATRLTTIDTVVDAIKVVTDNLPDSGALTSIAQEATLTTMQGATFNGATDSLEAIRDAIDALDGVAFQPSLAISVSVTDTETTLFDKETAGHMYELKTFRLKSAAPGGGNNMTVRLYEEVNDSFITVDSFTINSSNYTTYHSLMDMFGIDKVAGEKIKITGQMNNAVSVATTGQAIFTDTIL